MTPRIDAFSSFGRRDSIDPSYACRAETYAALKRRKKMFEENPIGNTRPLSLDERSQLRSLSKWAAEQERMHGGQSIQKLAAMTIVARAELASSTARQKPCSQNGKGSTRPRLGRKAIHCAAHLKR